MDWSVILVWVIFFVTSIATLLSIDWLFNRFSKYKYDEPFTSTLFVAGIIATVFVLGLELIM